MSRTAQQLAGPEASTRSPPPSDYSMQQNWLLQAHPLSSCRSPCMLDRCSPEAGARPECHSRREGGMPEALWWKRRGCEESPRGCSRTGQAAGFCCGQAALPDLDGQVAGACAPLGGPLGHPRRVWLGAPAGVPWGPAGAGRAALGCPPGWAAPWQGCRQSPLQPAGHLPEVGGSVVSVEMPGR